MIPMGRLTKKIQCQERCCSRSPPTAGPVTMPTDTIVPITPSALPLSVTGKASVKMPAPRARIIAAPTACTTRKPISQPTVGDSPHRTEPTVKTT